MKQTKLILVATCFLALNSFSQMEDLTPKEKQYRDSITKLNQQNATIAASQEAYNKGIELYNEKKFTEAISEFKKSITSDPNFTAAYYNKGVAENEAEKYQDAVLTLTTLIDKQPGYSKAYFQRGRSYQGLNDYLKSEKDYEKSIALEPTNPKAYYNYGTLKFLQLDYNAAIKYFTKTIELDANNAYAYNDRGSCYRMLNQLPKAIADYEEAQRKNPNLAFVLNNIGTAKKKMKDYVGAVAAFNRAISIDPNYYLAYNNRGATYVDKGGANDDAIKDFEKALLLNDSYGPAASNLSGVYFIKKDYKKALEMADKAIALDPNYAAAYVNRGMAKEMLRDLEGACQDWKKANELGSKEGKVYYAGNCSN